MMSCQEKRTNLAYLRGLICLAILVIASTAAAGDEVWLESLDDEILKETRNGSMWQLERSKRLKSEEKVKMYLEQLNTGRYKDWRLPTKSELFRFTEIFDWKKNGDVRIKIEGDHWLIGKSDKITAGKWELDDLCGPERKFYTKKSGYVRAIRP